MKFLSVILLAIAISQVTIAETLPELLEETRSIVENRAAEVGQLIGRLGKEIGITSGSIENNIKEAAQQLTNQIAGIGDLVNTSITKATDLEKNIDSCVSKVQSSVSSLSLDVLNTCEVRQELANVRLLISQLVRLPRQLGIIIPKCLAGVQEDVSNIRTCLGEGLQAVDDTIGSVLADAVTLIENALDNANKCIEGAVSEVNSSITTITDGLNECVDDILSS